MQSEQDETPFEIGFGYTGVPSNEVATAVGMMQHLVGALAIIVACLQLERLDEFFNWAKHGDEDHSETLHRLWEYGYDTATEDPEDAIYDIINFFLSEKEPPPLPDLRPEAD
jgi:hypothetical protein